MKVTNQSQHNAQILENKGIEKASGAAQKREGNPILESGASFKGSGASVEISDNARLMQRATEVAKQAPDMRADKVASLKQAIANGTYKVDAEAIADRLVSEHLNSDFGRNNL